MPYALEGIKHLADQGMLPKLWFLLFVSLQRLCKLTYEAGYKFCKSRIMIRLLHSMQQAAREKAMLPYKDLSCALPPSCAVFWTGAL